MTRSTRSIGLMGYVGVMGALLSGACSVPAPADGTKSWDMDQDGYSDAVERDTLNKRLYGFDTLTQDPHRSYSMYEVDGGYLVDGIHLPRTHANYYIYDPTGASNYAEQSRRRQWGNRWLINEIEGVARDWAVFRLEPKYCVDEWAYSSHEFGVGDLSLGHPDAIPPRFGGDFNPSHQTHQNGLDVDIRFLRTDAGRYPVDLQTTDSLKYDSLGTRELVECFYMDQAVQHIYVDTLLAKIRTFGDGVIVHEPYVHYNHFHVRLFNPY